MSFFFLDKKICISCKENLKVGKYLCDECKEKLVLSNFEYQKENFKLKSIYIYSGLIRDLIIRYKFDRDTSLSYLFSEIFIEYDRRKQIFKNYDFLLTVPMSKRKKNKRGFDHMRLITDKFIKQTSLNYINSIYKIKDTKNQHQMNLNDRKTNLNSAFLFKNKEKIEGKKVLIIDDIVTTGFTIKEIYDTIKAFKPKKVGALALTYSEKIENN